MFCKPSGFSKSEAHQKLGIKLILPLKTRRNLIHPHETWLRPQLLKEAQLHLRAPLAKTRQNKNSQLKGFIEFFILKRQMNFFLDFNDIRLKLEGIFLLGV